ncbi:conserved oligomeric Golgi complex subunit 1-like [Oppia nitens]|uniref:conserved oligomeric Golgi complex subunit 1-like n=1 Tax=Oppia nitens TaxID=1686743 RepID=UPI0023D9EA5A|nr:conserved oligomeric Golgi complex subunit 1-like [Oppia nitens]
MSETNVDYLLEKFTIAEIVEIKDKLKTDIDRKKQELKQLVGERYGDLIEAVDTIKQMNQSVDNVLKSLQVLNNSQSKHRILAPNRHYSSGRRLDGIDADDDRKREFALKRYRCGLVLKVITQLPLTIWTAIENDNLLVATYNYFYGQHLCALFEQLVAESVTPKLFIKYRTAINRFKEIIVEKCWDYDRKSSFQDNVVDSTSADIFCCLLLLQNISPKEVFILFLDKRKSYLNDCFNNKFDLNQKLHYFMNLLFNTIKCIHSVFFSSVGGGELKTKTLLHQRYERFTKLSFESDFIKQRNLSKELKIGITEFKINSKPVIDFIDQEMLANETKTWISDIKSLLEPLLRNTFESIHSVNQICVLLNEINLYLIESHKLNDWENYCEDLMTNYLPIWDHFVIVYVIQRIKFIISANISKTIELFSEKFRQFISDPNIKSKDLEVIDFVWGETEYNSLSLSKKSFAQISLIDDFCRDFDTSLAYLLNDIKIIKEFNFKLIKTNDLDDIESHLVNTCYSMIEDIKKQLESIDPSLDKDDVIDIFSAQFLRQLTQSCPHFTQCFETLTPVKLHSWSKTKDLLLSYSYTSYKRIFETKIKQLFSDTTGDKLTDLNEFINNSFIWDKIQTKEVSDEGKEIISKIEVPLQLSAFLHKRLTQLCNEINKLMAHTIPRVVVIDVLSALNQQITQTYTGAHECLSTKDYSENIKQVYALQFYFELLFIKQLLGSTHDETIKSKEMTKTNELMKKFETFIDPFDLHVFYPHVQTNVAKLSASTAVTFGLLLPDAINMTSDIKSKQQTSGGNNELHNIMLFQSTQKAFTLLNVNSLSKK